MEINVQNRQKKSGKMNKKVQNGNFVLTHLKSDTIMKTWKRGNEQKKYGNVFLRKGIRMGGAGNTKDNKK